MRLKKGEQKKTQKPPKQNRYLVVWYAHLNTLNKRLKTKVNYNKSRSKSISIILSDDNNFQ